MNLSSIPPFIAGITLATVIFLGVISYPSEETKIKHMVKFQNNKPNAGEVMFWDTQKRIDQQRQQELAQLYNTQKAK